jgi:hypothetical protein
MMLNVIPDPLIENPTAEDITFFLEKAYAGKVEAVVLIADKYRFIQVASGGGHVEYQEEKEGIIYAVEQVSLSECVTLFLDYSQNGSQWKEMLSWFPYLDQRGRVIQSKETPSLFIEVRLQTRRKWKTRQVLLAVTFGFVAVILYCLLAMILPLEEILIPSLVLTLGGIPWLILRTMKQERFVLFRTWFAILLLCIAVLFTIGGLTFTMRIVNLISLSTLAVLVVGLWSIITSIRILRDAYHFDKESIEVEASGLSITYMDLAEHVIPVLNYIYMGKYQDYKAIRWKDKRISKALNADRLRVFVRYLAQDPRIHRVSRIGIDKAKTN